TSMRQPSCGSMPSGSIDATERLVRPRAQATIAAVTKESGVSRVTVYSHFATREELIEAVVERATRAASDSIEEARPMEGDPVEALERVLSVSWEQLERH